MGICGIGVCSGELGGLDCGYFSLLSMYDTHGRSREVCWGGNPPPMISDPWSLKRSSSSCCMGICSRRLIKGADSLVNLTGDLLGSLEWGCLSKGSSQYLLLAKSDDSIVAASCIIASIQVVMVVPGGDWESFCLASGPLERIWRTNLLDFV